ncbi:unnamed protein product [Paramecium octaurelia]|uniref:Uncharacterized protein n=1 Tax=Paramecium octaurelia TaxID=43137 RepID=A0A8S1SKN4_PAROT|nr:unnamed protein product [Paramecium octaurelia]
MIQKEINSSCQLKTIIVRSKLVLRCRSLGFLQNTNSICHAAIISFLSYSLIEQQIFNKTLRNFSIRELLRRDQSILRTKRLSLQRNPSRRKCNQIQLLPNTLIQNQESSNSISYIQKVIILWKLT